MRAVRAIGNNAVFESNSGTPDPGDFHKLGAIANNSLICGPFPPPSAIGQFPFLGKLKSDLDAQNATGDTAATWTSLRGTDEWAWWDTQAFADLGKTISGTVNAASVMQALETVKNLNVGLIPPWTPSLKGPPGYTQVSNPYEYEMIIKNSESTLLSTTPVNAQALFTG
jgi:hypothetical protein